MAKEKCSVRQGTTKTAAAWGILFPALCKRLRRSHLNKPVVGPDPFIPLVSSETRAAPIFLYVFFVLILFSFFLSFSTLFLYLWVSYFCCYVFYFFFFTGVKKMIKGLKKVCFTDWKNVPGVRKKIHEVWDGSKIRSWIQKMVTMFE